MSKLIIAALAVSAMLAMGGCQEQPDSYAHRQRVAAEAAQKKAAVRQATADREKAEVEADRQACISGGKAKLAAYRKLMAAGQHWDATLQLRQCAELTGDASLKKLIADAEVKSYVADLTSAKVPVATKERSLASLRSDYPEEAKRFAAWDQRLQREAVEQTAASKRKLLAERRRYLPRIGLTAQQVVDEWWGPPASINRTVTARGTSEQWVYQDRAYLYFTDGILTAVQD